MFAEMAGYFQNNMDDFLRAIATHAGISALALLLAAAVGIPAGILCVRCQRLQRWVVPLFQGLRILPSLAVLFLLIPVLGTGLLPALVALVLLAVPSILLNTVAGLTQTPEFMLETAAACGMTSGQIWRRVWLPMALPMILTGIKNAVTEIIASATLVAKIGAGGLGEIIFTGLGLYRFDLLLAGGVTVALLSLLSAGAVGLLGRILMRYKYI